MPESESSRPSALPDDAGVRPVSERDEANESFLASINKSFEPGRPSEGREGGSVEQETTDPERENAVQRRRMELRCARARGTIQAEFDQSVQLLEDLKERAILWKTSDQDYPTKASLTRAIDRTRMNIDLADAVMREDWKTEDERLYLDLAIFDDTFQHAHELSERLDSVLLGDDMSDDQWKELVSLSDAWAEFEMENGNYLVREPEAEWLQSRIHRAKQFETRLRLELGETED